MVTFSFVAMDQIVNQASKIRYMFGGQADFPVTYRCTIGGGMGMAAQHSQSPYSMWMHLAGLKIILPSTPADAIHCFLATGIDYLILHDVVMKKKPAYRVVRPVASFFSDVGDLVRATMSIEVR